MVNIQPGDLIFVRGTSLLDRGIEVVEHSPYSHVALYAGDGKVIEAQGGRTVGYNDLSAYAGQYDVGRVQCASFRRAAVMDYAKSKFGCTYDFPLIAFLFAKLMLHIDWAEKYDERGKFICITLAADAWKDAGVILSPNKYPTFSDLANSPLVSLTQTTI